jgi:hypothetical protein
LKKTPGTRGVRGAAAAPHQAEIRVLGRHNFASSGDFVDVDALVGR